MSPPVGEHGGQILRLKQLQSQKGDDRNGSEEVHRETPFRRVDANLPAQLEPLPDDLRQRVQDFSEVSSRLTLNLERRYEDPNVGKRHPNCQIAKRVL